MKISKYANFINIQDDIYAVFNSLLMQIIFVNKDKLNQITNFNVDTNGNLTCSNADLTGYITATGGVISALLTEIILTGIFVYVILNVTDEKSGNSKLAGIVIGLTLTLVHLIGITLTGTSVNPARSLAPAIFLGGQALTQVWVFILAPLVGSAIAAIVFKYLNKAK